MKFSAFARFGHLRFSSKPPIAQTIYEAMVRALGGEEMVANGGEEIDETIHARLYAHAMRIATAQRNFDRVRGNMNPATSVELLSYWESVYGLHPLPSASADERRATLDAAQQMVDGCRPDVVLTAMQDLLGSHLITVRKMVNAAPETRVSPTDWDTPSTRPGTWKAPTTAIKRRTLDRAISSLGSQEVDTTYEGGSDEMFIIGDMLVVDPGKVGIQEAVQIEAVDGDTITTTFTKTHDSGAELSTIPWPTAFTTARHVLIVTDSTVARSSEWRRKINAKLHKLLRAVDTWDVVEEYSAGQLGPFKVGEGLIGITPIMQIST